MIIPDGAADIILGANGSRPIKCRRTRLEMDVVRDAIYDVLDDQHPATVRGVYYQVVSAGAVPKTEAQYKTVVRLLVEMRANGTIPYTWIADATRWMRKPRTYSSLGSMLDHTVATYRRALWDDQDTYVEVWLEKEALAGVISAVTGPWDVPLMVTRGYPSLSFMYSAAETIKAANKPTHLYYLGDHDPSGQDISRHTEAKLRELAPDAEIAFERIAVTEAQIQEMNLLTRPTKKTDSRSKGFVGESVEVDAIAAPALRQLVEARIVSHIDGDALDRLYLVEDAERDTLRQVVEAARGWGS